MSRCESSGMRLLLFAGILGFALPGGARAQSILTIAGGGSDDGRPGSLAALRVPFGVAVRGTTGVVIADSYDHRIRLLDLTTGVIRDVAGNGTSSFSGDGGPATLAGLSEPETVAVDRDGNLIVADTHNCLVRAVDLESGTIRTIAGLATEGGCGFGGDGGPATAARLAYPRGVAVDASGNIFVADTLNNRVRRVDAATGNITTLAGTGVAGFSGDGGPATAAAFNQPRGLLLQAGSLLVADSGNNVVRRIGLADGTLDSVAGTGAAGFGGDGGAATAARLSDPRGLAEAPNGDLLITDAGNDRIRRIRAADGTISTVAGTGTTGYGGDGGPATLALLASPSGVAVTEAGLILVADTQNNRIRRIGTDGRIYTLAGVGSRGLIGDGGPATAAGLAFPSSAIVSGTGDLIVADTYNHRIRRVSATTGTIDTVAGAGLPGFDGDGGPATVALLNYPQAVCFLPGGELVVADTENHRIRRIDAATGIVRTVAGTGAAGFGGDAGPATAAALNGPAAVLADGTGNLFIADTRNHRVRRVDASTGLITTLAGTGLASSSGDGGPAAAAALDLPSGLVLDGTGGLLVAETNGHRVRRVDLATGLIGTLAGTGAAGFAGDGGAASAAQLAFPWGLARDAGGNVLIADTANARVRRIENGTGRITTVAGARSGYSGDGGPATSASFTEPRGVVVDAVGNLLIADTKNNRIRAVYACGSVGAPALTNPPTGPEASAVLTWSPVAGAFRYDLYLDTANPPTRILAGDLGYSTPTPFTVPPGTSYTYSASNLLPATSYSWRVVAKGDPFCPSVSTAPSDVRTFTTAGVCTAPSSFALSWPGDGATGVTSGVLLSWQPASGAGSYDVSLGSSNPPPLAASGVAGTSFTATGLTAGATYYWSVTARASCDPTKTTLPPVRSFVLSGGCLAPGSFSSQYPSSGATGVLSNPTLSWSASSNASSYDVYLGTSTIPPLYLADISKTTVAVSGLAPGATYFWKVVAKTSCNASLTSTIAVQSFSVAGTCNAPGARMIVFVPPGNVGVGQTYVVAWTDAPGLDAGGGYVVERSTSSSFSPLLDSQTTTATAASFTSASEGTYHHRVRALPACDPTKAGPWSDSRPVTVVTGTPDVIFTVQPAAVVTALGEKIDDNKKTSFTLEKIGKAPLTLQLSQQFLGPTAFFTIVDPFGGSVNGFTLESRKPKTFDLRFQGADANTSGSYQGVVIVLQANFQPLAIAPFAFVNLKVGGAETATPSFKVGGTPTEYAVFSGAAGDRPTRTLSVDVVNAGSSPMDLAAEIGPELWLVPNAGWNSIPISPGTSRTVTFTTDRTRAPNGSALPRYTYFTLRTKDGRTARLLVQDNGPSDLGQGRTSQLAPGVRSYVVPSVVRATSKILNTFVTKLRLSNAGSDPVQADLLYTPRDADGFGAEVRRATVLVPANDVVILTNPLVQLYGYPPDSNVSGQLEVRTAPERIGSLTVTSSVDAPAPGGGAFGFQMPTANRGEGARVGHPHSISGITFTSAYRTNLILAETTGIDHAAVRATLFDKDGNRKGDTLLDVPRYGQKQVAVTDLWAPDGLEAGQIELAVESGGGAAVGLITVIDNTNDDAVTYFGRPVAGSSGAARIPTLLARIAPPLSWAKAAATLKLVVPAVVNGFSTFRDSPLPYTFQSLMGFSSGSQSPATFHLTYKDLSTGQSIARALTVPGRSTREYKNVLEELFGIPKGQKSQGPVFVEADANGTMYCKVFSILQSGTLGDGFPVVPVPAESLTGNRSAKPIYVDGLEQSVDIGRGTRSNLILNEVAGLASATVLVQLYEPGNRSTPIAQQEVTLTAGEKKQLSTVFSGLGLESVERNKDRTNVLCVVTATSGSGLVSAVVTTIDNKTGDTKNSLLTPTGGVSASGGGAIGF